MGRDHTGLAILVTIWLGVALLIFAVAGLSLRGFLIFLIASTLAAPFVGRIMRRQFSLFEPLVLANVSLAAMFVVRPLADIYTRSYVHLGYDVMPEFEFTLFLAWIAAAAFQIGYASPFANSLARRLHRPKLHLNSRTAVLAALVIALVGGSLFGAFISTQGGLSSVIQLGSGRRSQDNSVFLGSTGYFYQAIDSFTTAAVLLFAAGIIAKKRFYILGSIVLAVPPVLYWGGRGDRSFLLPLILGIPTFWYLWRRRQPRLGTVLAVAVVSVLALSALREFRVIELRSSHGTGLAGYFSDPAEQTAEMFSGGDDDMFDALANEVAIVPDTVPFMPGGTILDIVTRMVPRPLWPDKPPEVNGVVVSTLWPERSQHTRAMPATSVIGAFYADSGIIGVSIGMLALGIAIAALWKWYQRYSTSTYATVLMAMCLPYVVILMRGYVADTLARATFTVIPLLALKYARMVPIRLRRA